MARDPNRPDEVDFVLGPDDLEAADEELVHGRPRARSRTSALVAVAVVAVAVVVAIGVHRSGRSAPSAAASRSPAPSSDSAPAVAPDEPQLPSPVVGPRTAIRHDKGTVIFLPASTAPASVAPPGPACHVAGACRTSTTLPAAVLRALRARYTGVTVDSSTSVLTGATMDRLRLYRRTVLAHTAALTLTLDVHPILATDRSQAVFGNSGAGVSVTVTDAHRPWTVEVTVRNPRTLDPDTMTPSELAADPRLFAA